MSLPLPASLLAAILALVVAHAVDIAVRENTVGYNPTVAADNEPVEIIGITPQ